MLTADEVVAHMETWGNTVDEVAAYLTERGIRDSFTNGTRISEACLIAMGVRDAFPELNDNPRRLCVGNGVIVIPGSNTNASMPDPVQELQLIADQDRGEQANYHRYPALARKEDVR